MNVIVAYYSWQGHTEKVAEEIASKLDAELVKIEALKDSGMPIKAMKAMFGMKSDIKPCKTDLSDIDHLVVATPVWAGHSTPFMNKYLSLLENCSGKSFSVVAEMGKSGAEKTINQIRNELEKKGMKFVSSAFTLEKDVNEGNFDDKTSKLVETIKK